MRARLRAVFQPHVPQTGARQKKDLRTKDDESERGAILILVALTSVILIGMTALTLDVGYAYDMRNRLSATADAAAKSAAYEVWRGNSVNYRTFAERVLAEDAAAGRIPSGVTPTIRLCSDAGATCAAGFSSNKYVEVILARPQGTFLGGTLGISSLTPTARAVAGYSSSTACIVTLGGSPSMSIGNTTINSPHCGVSVGGTLTGTNPNATITASFVTSSTCTGRCDGFTPLTTAMPPSTDPLLSLPTPAACSGTAFSGSSWTAGCYSTVNLTGTVTMAPGNYYVTGTITIGGNITGSGGVLLYLGPSAQIVFNNHISLTLVAATTGPYAGIAFFQDRSNANPIALGNNSDLAITGAFYAPAADMSTGNSLGNAGTCSLVVVKSLAIPNGNGLFDNTCTAYGGSPLTSIAMAE